VLRSLYGPKRDELTEVERNCIMRSDEVRWTGHIAQIERKGMHIGFGLKGQKERDN
jgi:hypothetical protein